MSNVGGTAAKGAISRYFEIKSKEKADENSKKYKLDKEISALSELKSKLESLKTAIESMDESTDFTDRKTSILQTDSPVFSATAQSGTLVGDYKFEIVQLATASKRMGASNVGANVSATSDVSGVTLSTMNISSTIKEGTITVNGQQITIATTDSLQDVFDAISTATSGVVTAAYNETTDKVELTGSSNITLGSAADTSNFLSALKLYANGTTSVISESSLGATRLPSAISSANLGTTPTSGSFKINGVSFTYDVDADSISSIMQQINSSAAGVNILYDPVNDKFSLNNTVEGNFDLAVEDTNGNLLEVMGLNSTSTLSTGTNAQFKLNDGATLTSNSNTLDSSVHGITGLSIKALQSGLSDTVSVASDPKGAKEKIETLVEKYNEVQSYIKTNSQLTKDSNNKPTASGPFFGNHEVYAISRELRTMVYTSVTSLSGSIKRLSDLGIDFKSDSNEIEIKDADTLNAALANNSNTVSTLFIDATNGFATTLKAFISNATGTTGGIETSKKGLEGRKKEADERIAKILDEMKKMEEEERRNEAIVQSAQNEMLQKLQQLESLRRPLI